MRGPSEIDIGRPRYRDRPDPIIQTIVGNLDQPIRSHRTHFEGLAREAEAAGRRIVEAVRRGGLLRYLAVRRLMKTTRGYLPIREHPKYLLIRFLGIARKTLLDAGESLRLAGQLDRAEDVWQLELAEVIEALEGPGRPLQGLVEERRTVLQRYHKQYPPRVLTSEGEAPVVRHDDAHVPAGALVGSAASAGVVEGIARVILDPHGQSLQKGEILVAPFTDPGWTTLFINAAGLVMEVGGLMTHGSVVAREYHIPAVVCVPGVTRKIRTGQRVRVNGTEGYVEILDENV